MKQKSIELITFDKTHKNLLYQGECKLRLNRLSQMFCVEPKNEDYKMIFAIFKWKFYLDMNILFIFGEHDFQDFVLIFDEETRAKIVYDFICKENAQNALIGREMLFERFMGPFCKMVLASEPEYFSLITKSVQIFQQWIEKHKNEEKENFTKFLKQNNVFDIFYSNATVVEEKVQMNNRKRRFSEIDNPQNYNTDGIQFTRNNKKTPKNYSKIVENSFIEFCNIETGNHFYRRLLIFTSLKRDHCYEYLFNEKRNLYYCIGCKKITAILDKDKNGLECVVKIEDVKHFCSPKKYIPENYVKFKVIKKSNFEILENCNAVNGKVLLIFNENDATECWEFKAAYAKNIFTCKHCGVAAAKFWNSNNAEDEYIELRNVNHLCKFVQVSPKKYYQFKQFVLAPNFEIQKIFWSGEEKERLIIFDTNDRSLCYSYTCDKNIFFCNGCKRKRHKVPAKLLQNSNGENYVLLSKRQHICELRQYSKTKEEIIIHAPNFKLMESTNNKIKKLFIFVEKNSNLCYIFSECKNRYACLGCQNICYNKKQQRGKIVTAQICSKDSENFVRLNYSKHLCQPQKYEPEKFQKKEKSVQKCYDFFFFRRKIALNGINVALCCPDDDSHLCFEYTFQNSNIFRCNKCSKKGSYCSTKIEIDENGKEYFISNGNQNHICKPIKISSICAPNFVILNRKDLTELNKKKEEIDENRIIKAPNFQLGPNEKGIPDTSLFIFTSKENDQNYGYKYFYMNRDKKFICCSRNIAGCRCSSMAKLSLDTGGEKCVIMGLAEHKCQPIKYKDAIEKDNDDDDREIKTSNFIIVKNNDAIISHIIIFTAPSSQSHCFEYGKITTKKNVFRCLGCLKANRIITVEYCKDENEKEYLKLSKHEHVCAPRKYIEGKYNKKIISNDSFSFHDGNHGEKDKYLIVFISDKKDIAYQYYVTRGRSYRCSGCTHTACVIENDDGGGKSVRLGSKKHSCQPIKYDPKKYVITEVKEPKIITKELFQFLPNTKGEANRALIIFTSDEKNHVYEYHYSKGLFKCSGCTKKKFYKTEKNFKVDENGIVMSLKLDQKEHICEPIKYDPKNYIFLPPKFISNEYFKIYDGKNGEKFKYLIVFTPDKKFVYQFNINRYGYYYCRGCEKKSQYLSAKIIQKNGDEDGVVEIGGKEHICKPQKYNPKKY